MDTDNTCGACGSYIGHCYTGCDQSGHDAATCPVCIFQVDEAEKAKARANAFMDLTEIAERRSTDPEVRSRTMDIAKRLGY